MIDLYCYILLGIDDGVENLDVSIVMVEKVI